MLFYQNCKLIPVDSLNVIQVHKFIDRLNKMSMDFYSNTLLDHEKVEKQMLSKNKRIEELEQNFQNLTEHKVKIQQRNDKLTQIIKKMRHRIKQQNLQNDNLDMSALKEEDSVLISFLKDKSQNQEESFNMGPGEVRKEITFQKSVSGESKNLGNIKKDLGSDSTEKFSMQNINILDELDDK